MPHKTKTM